MYIMLRSQTFFLLALLTCGFFFVEALGHSAGQPRPLTASEIIRKAVAATEHSWQARAEYNYMKRDEDRRLDAQGHVKSARVDVFKMIIVNGARFEQAVEHNGRPPSPDEMKKLNEQLEKMKRQSSEEKATQLRKEQEGKEFLGEVLKAFDFQLIGEELVNDRPAYLLAAKPRPAYHSHSKYASIITKLDGKLWIDKQDFGWIKFDGQVTDSFSIGMFIARVQRGARIFVEQTPVADAVWLPKRVELQAGAKLFFVKNLAVDRILTYSDYQRVDSLYSVNR
jgi:hypothetical protein